MYKMDSNRWAVVGIVSWVFLNMLDFIHIIFYILQSESLLTIVSLNVK